MSETRSPKLIDLAFEERRLAKAASFWKKRRHRIQVRRLARLLPPNGMFVDAGGYLGNVTYHVVQTSGCRALVFEPVAGHYEFCRKRFEGSPDVVVERLGLSDESGSVEVFRGHKNLAWNTMLASMTNLRNRQLAPEVVSCVRFDDYRHNHPVPRVDVVKIDVEGYEWRVLHGMRGTVQDDLPHIECEIHFGRRHPEWERQAKEFQYLFDLGYPRFDIEETLNPTGRKIVNLLLSHPARTQTKEKMPATVQVATAPCTETPPKGHEAQPAGRPPRVRCRAKHLIRLVRRLEQPALRGAEIGVYKGETSAALLWSFPQLELLMNDVWQAYPTGHPYRRTGDALACLTQSEQELHHRTALAATEFAEQRRKVMRMTSAEAAQRVDDGSLDFVFIDANHSYESVREDLSHWWPKVRSGGLFCGHDYGHPLEQSGGFGVSRAVDEFFRERVETVHLAKCTIWWTRKA